MPIAPKDFWQVARDLHNRVALPADEPCHRTVIGRAYYAAYLATREAVRQRYNDPNFDVHHQTLADALKGNADPDVADIGARLDRLFHTRSRADYRMRERIDALTAGLMVSSSEHVIASLPGIQSRIPKGIQRR